MLSAKDNDVLTFGLRPQDDRLVAPGADEAERAVVAALAPWQRRLALEGLQRWLVRGAAGAVGAACLVLAVGWLVPVSESELRPLALELAAVAMLAALARGAWPVATARRASELDARLGLADRLATAWAERHATRPMARRQRADALARLAERSPRHDLPLTWARREVGALAALTVLAAVLLFAPSPMQGLLQQQAADRLAVEETARRLEVLRHEVAEAPDLTPEQVRQLDELLQQAQHELAGTHTEQEAAAVLARAAEELTRLSELAADNRAEALAAMSETLTREPLARPLGEALQRGDGPAAGEALRTLAERADELSDVQRQALARALQRAANLGRGDPRSAEALHEAAQALSDANAEAGPALQAASDALEAAVRLANAQAALRSAAQQAPEAGGEADQAGAESGQARREPGRASGEPGRAGEEPGQAGGPAAAALSSQPPPAFAAAEASEDVVVPGRPSDALEAGEVVQQPLSVRGQPRPYREVLAQYAQSGRDYVERASVPPSVRELVKRYFVDLQEP